MNDVKLLGEGVRKTPYFPMLHVVTTEFCMNSFMDGPLGVLLFFAISGSYTEGFL